MENPVSHAAGGREGKRERESVCIHSTHGTLCTMKQEPAEDTGYLVLRDRDWVCWWWRVTVVHSGQLGDGGNRERDV